MREWLTRLVDWFRRDRLDRELAEELRFHEQQLARDVAPASDAEESGFTARRQLGNTTSVRETARDLWSIPWLDHAQQDVRYAFRGLRRSPGFTIAVTVTLALGIGANAAMFGVVDRLMFRPFAYLRDPASVDRVYLESTYRGTTRTQSTFPYTRYLDLQRATSSFSQSAGVSEWRLAIGTGESAREQQVLGVSASFFDFFDARPALGRFFDASEDVVPRGADVVVLSDSYWRGELGARNVLGEKLQIGPLLLTVIGVAPKGFVGVAEGEAPAAFVPITTYVYGLNQGDAPSFARRYNWDWMGMMVRRKPGVSPDAATRDLTNAYIQSRDLARVQLPSILPATIAHPRGIAGSLKTAAGPGAGLESATLLWVTGVALIVLLIACANVANLMFARVLRRRREIAVRLALGVSRARLAAQYLTEGLILATLGCVAGVAMAQWLSAALRPLLISDGITSGLAMEWRSLGIASLLAIVAAVATSVGPALLAIRGDLALTLRTGTRSTHQRSRIRSALLVLQAALSVALLIGAGLFVRSLDHVRSIRLGWDPEPVLIVTPNYRGLTMDTNATAAFRRRLLLAARAIPGVQYATRINSLPFATSTMDFTVPGVDSIQRLGRFNFQATTPDYFKALDTRIVRGRAFTDRDRNEKALVTVVSQAMARALWPSDDPIGKCMYLRPAPTSCVTVIGVAEDAAQQTISDNERFMYYVPDEQPPFSASNRLVLRMSGGAPAQMERVRRALQRIMPGQAYVTVAPLDEIVDRQRRSWRLGATMFAGFGVLAVIVAAVGLYGVIAYGVTQRMHELGVRIALGARSANIVRLVVGQGITFAGTGIIVGLAIAIGASRWIQPLLFEQSATDPIVFGAVGIVIGFVALAACAVPAVRATRADPNAALRSD